MKISFYILGFLAVSLLLQSCGENTGKPASHQHEGQDGIYSCPMHPEIVSDAPGTCPICKMDLVEKVSGGGMDDETELTSVLQPPNTFVISSLPVTTIQKGKANIKIEALGNVAYDTRYVGTVPSRVSGRIEKLYVRYRYQKVLKGQRLLDLYSPEMLTAQQNLLFLLKNDADNTGFIAAAKEKLLLLGMSHGQLEQVIQSGKASPTITLFSNYNGHLHETNDRTSMGNTMDGMQDIISTTPELSLKEGDYVDKGQPVFSIYNTNKAWAILNIYPDHQNLLRTGDPVRIVPETAPADSFDAKINFIEPFYRGDNKTMTVRVYFDNSKLQIPIGSQVRASISITTETMDWLPKDAIVSLGLEQVVFKKTTDGFAVQPVRTGIMTKDSIQVLDGLSAIDSVAANAQYLMDSESFIKINN